MDEKEQIQQITDALEKICASLSGKELNIQSLAEALETVCPNVPQEELRSDCKQLLEGIRSGEAYAGRLMEMSEDELQQELPNLIQRELSGMTGAQQHQYLILLYQLLSEQVEKPISPEETLCIANASNQEIYQRVGELAKLASAELVSQTAEQLQSDLDRIQGEEAVLSGTRYSQEEKTQILAAAMYAQMRANQPQKVPAVLVGEIVGAASYSALSLRSCILSEVIPTAVAALSVAVTCALAFLCVKAIVTHSLFLPAITWIKAHSDMAMLRIALLCVGAKAAESGYNVLRGIASSTFNATLALTCRYIKEDAQQAFLQSQPPLSLGGCADTKTIEAALADAEVGNKPGGAYPQQNAEDAGEDPLWDSQEENFEVF